MKNAENIDEYASQFDQFDLKVVEEIKGFEPNKLFMKHMIYVGYNVSYSTPFYLDKRKMKTKTLRNFLLKILTLLAVPMNHIDNMEEW